MQAAMLLGLVVRIVPGVPWTPLFVSAWKVILSSLVMAGALHWIAALGVSPAETLVSRAWFLFGQIGIGSLVFVAMARLLDMEELPLVWRLIVAKFERNILSPPENREAPIA
jgi:uncharacterized membrane protein